MKAAVSLFLGSLALVACAPSQPERAVESSIQANAAAPGHTEWELSEQHPTNVFLGWRQENASPDGVCAALTARTPLELTLFEEEIKNPENAALLAPCLNHLKTTVGDYWSAVSQTVPAAPLQKFPSTVVERDFSNGYFAFTADLKPRQVLLTFDDGPHPEYTSKILKTLEAANAKAIFFEMGSNVRAFPQGTKMVAAAGHGIGSHSITHRCLAYSSLCEHNVTNKGHRLRFSEAVAEIVGGHRAVFDVLGFVDPFFRFPYGESSDELKRFLMDRATGAFAWNMDSEDWKAQPAEHVLANTMAQLTRTTRGIILFHDIQHRTSVMLPDLLRELYFRGYQVVTLRASDPQARFNSQLLKRSTVTAQEESGSSDEAAEIVPASLTTAIDASKKEDAPKKN